MTRARGLHATRSSIRSDNGTSSLPERRIARRFFLCRWHRAHTYHPLNVRISTAADRWPGSRARISCAPCPGHMCASGEPLGAAATLRLRRGMYTFFAHSSYVNHALFRISRTSARSYNRETHGNGHDRFEDLIVMLMQHSGMSAIGEPRNVVNGLIPRPLLREYTQGDCVHRVFQGAVPDVAYRPRTRQGDDSRAEIY